MAEELKGLDGEWKAENYTANQWDPKGGPDGKGGPRKGYVGWKPSDEYRDGWDRIFGRKPLTFDMVIEAMEAVAKE